ncbi:hypothetical protein C8N46_11044 [Kordia periserrulae]|uniref:Uncharacterized protein n=1 Tax=Kordia periserrulae TaxID=701523 RepID=A0A2T6BSZ8_9FLAO|nr:hypothetical protein [Kordia periserrulae]PTX59208.1 hypothetical protein C8N46_11044 [Kordia periserrulae]
MKKQNLKSLKLSKKSISNLTREQTTGGTFITVTCGANCEITGADKQNTCYASCPGGTTC